MKTDKVFPHSKHLFFVVNAKGFITNASTVSFQTTDKRMEAFKGFSFVSLIFSSYKNKIKTILANTAIKVKTIEIELIDSNNLSFWYNVKIKRQLNVSGKAVFFIYCQNIDSEKREQIKLNEFIVKLKAENTLLRNEVLMNYKALQSTEAIILILNSDLKITSISTGAEKILGYKNKEIRNNGWFEKIVPFEKYPQYKQGFVRFLRAKDKLRVIEAPVICKYGIEKMISWKTNKIIIDGKLVGTIGVGRDITELNNGVKTLEESELKFRKLAELLPNPISCKTTSDKIIFLNNSYIKEFGYTLKDIPDFKSWLKHAYRSTKERKAASNTWKKDVALLQKGKKTPIRILEVFDKSGKKRILEHTTAINNEHIYCAYFDITEKRKQEQLLIEAKEKFKRIAENTAVALAGFNINTLEIEFINKKFSEVLGYKLNEIKQFSEWYNHFKFNSITERKKNITFWLSLFKKMKFRPTEPVKTIEHSIVCKDGLSRVFEIGITMDGDTVYGFFYDITERKSAEKKLKESEERFRSIAENLPIPVLSFHAEKGFLYYNKKYIKIIGEIDKKYHKPSGFIAFINKMSPTINAATNFKKTIVKLKKNQSTVSKLVGLKEIQINCIDGKLRTFRITETMFGKTLYSVFQDITEQIQSERQLQESEERFRNLSDNLPVPVISFHAEKGVLFVNRKYTEIVRDLSNEDRKPIKFSKIINDNSSISKKDNYLEKIVRSLKKNEENQLIQMPLKELKIICRDGIFRTFEVSETMFGKTLYSIFYDVSQQRETEERLQESEERFRSLADNLPVPVISFHLDKGVLYTNKKYETVVGKIEGYAKTPIGFRKFIQKNSIAEYNITAFDNTVMLLRNNKENRPMQIPTHELKILCSDGMFRTFELGETMFGKTLYSIFHDITEQRQVEKKLQESEERFRSLAENLPIPVVSVHPDLGLLFANKKHSEIIGHDNLNISNPEGFAEYVSNLSPEDSVSAGFLKTLKMLKNNPETEPKILPSKELQIVCKDGSLRYFQLNETMFGKILYTIFYDITEQRLAQKLLIESEQKFKAIAEHIPIAIGAHNLNEEIVFINKHLTDTIGYSFDEVSNLTQWYKRTQPNPTKRKLLHKHWIDTITAYRKERWEVKPQIKTTIQCKDGSLKQYDFLFSVHNDITYIMLIDITEQEEAKLQLESSHLQLRNLASHLQKVREEERKHMSREIHDELGQQLTSIKMDISFLHRQIKKSDTQMLQGCDDVMKMIDQSIKTVRRLSTELRPSILDDIGLGAAIEWQLTEFQKRTGLPTQHFIELEVEPEVEIRSQLFRIFQESLTNIMRHAHAKNVIVQLYQSDKIIFLSVKDNGKGFNIKKPTKTLGLLGMKERMLMLNGTFEIQSIIGKGTTLNVSVPIK